jgi:protein-tyrosine-phosphatase
MTGDSTERPFKGTRILFVCSGNTCRSPMAEILFQELATRKGLEGVLEARSAGTHANPGSPASSGALATALRHGHTLEGHEAVQLTPELLAWADLVLTMGPSHLQAVRMLGGGRKATLLGAFADGEDPGWSGERDHGHSVPDPFGGDEKVYEATYESLARYIVRVVERLSEADHQ